MGTPTHRKPAPAPAPVAESPELIPILVSRKVLTAEQAERAKRSARMSNVTAEQAVVHHRRRAAQAGGWLRPLLAAAVLLAVAKGAPAQNNCSATGVMGGEKFALSNCAVALLDDEHSVTLWFNDSPIAPREAEEFQDSAYANSSKDGKERTMLLVAFCPGGGKTAASPAAIRSIDLGMNHAKSPMVGAQWVVQPPKDFKVDKISGDIKPGGTLAGKITGSRTSDGHPYSWDLQFDVKLPEKGAASGVTCGK